MEMHEVGYLVEVQASELWNHVADSRQQVFDSTPFAACCFRVSRENVERVTRTCDGNHM